MKKVKKERWEMPLTLYLNEITSPTYLFFVEDCSRKSMKRSATPEERTFLKKRAVEDVVRGVKFLSQRKLPVISSVLARDFDIGDPCRCLLPKATRLEGFTEAANNLKLTTFRASMIGCEDPRNHQEGRQPNLDDWARLYNFLWKKVGRFLKAHPKLGVK